MRLKIVLRTVLVGLPVIMICWQVYASNYQHLTKWKGGGYGMYTDAHPEFRSIVLKLKDSTIHLYPLSKIDFNKLPSQIQKDYKSSRKYLKFAAFYPEFYQKRFLETTYLKNFDTENGTIEFYESYIDLDDRKAYPHKIYSYE